MVLLFFHFIVVHDANSCPSVQNAFSSDALVCLHNPIGHMCTMNRRIGSLHHMIFKVSTNKVLERKIDANIEDLQLACVAGQNKLHVGVARRECFQYRRLFVHVVAVHNEQRPDTFSFGQAEWLPHKLNPFQKSSGVHPSPGLDKVSYHLVVLLGKVREVVGRHIRCVRCIKDIWDDFPLVALGTSEDNACHCCPPCRIRARPYIVGYCRKISVAPFESQLERALWGHWSNHSTHSSRRC